MKVLITGGKGFLAQKLRKIFLSKNWQVGSTSRTAFLEKSSGEEFFTMSQDYQSIDITIKSFNPDWVVHAAAAARVDWCEQNPEDARSANAVFTQNIARACSARNTKLAYVSTDYVFDGKKQAPYAENDRCNPINVYGQTKYGGEMAAKSAKHHLILRIASPYGYNSPGDSNFLLKTIQSLSEGKSVDVATDSITTPTFLDDASNAFEKLLSKDCNGIYHVAGSKCISRFDFIKLAAKVFGFDGNLIQPTKMALLSPVKRPSYSCLKIDKIKKEGISMHDPETSLSILSKQIA